MDGFEHVPIPMVRRRANRASACESTRLIGTSSEIRAVRQAIPKLARARRTTLLCGPTGSGKEVVAAELHRAAFPGGAPFVVVHCGALPDGLMESELFGHVRGAFTGATESRDGLLRVAAEGTLFLDEVDSLSLPLQAKLLRLLENGEFRPVGADRNERAGAWVLAATNADLCRRAAEGGFRQDLLYRLQVMRLDVPPLRGRRADIELLVRHFLEVVAAEGVHRQLSSSALRKILAHDWPGNVRELKHAIERAAYMADGNTIEPTDLPFEILVARDLRESGMLADTLWELAERGGFSLAEMLKHCEQLLIHRAVTASGGSRAAAAARLGIHVRTIFKKIRSGKA